MEDNTNKNQLRKGVFIGAAVAVLVCALIFGTVLLGVTIKNKLSGGSGSSGLGSSAVDKKLDKIESILKQEYYGDLDEDAMTEGIYKGVMESIGDDYAEYYTAEELADELETTEGQFGGIGLLIQYNKETNQAVAVDVYKDSPAEKAGLKKDDIIIAADDHKFEDCADLDEFVSYIRGEKGTDVVITYQRDGKENQTTVTRDIIETQTVEGQMLTDDIGYIEISSFTENTKDQFDEVISDLDSQGMKKVILDLRTNGGGLVNVTIDMLDEILPEGELMYLEYADGSKETYSSSGKDFMTYDFVILTSEYTASAAEIFTGAMRDFNYATIIGTKTYGKGIVQDVKSLGDGTAIKYTVGKYFLPSGECIHEKGIDPDIELEYEFLGGEDDEYSYDKDNQIQKAIEVLNSK